MTIKSKGAYSDESQADDSLERLMIEQAEPLIREIVSHRLRTVCNASGRSAAASDSEDVCSEVRVQLLTRLAAFRSPANLEGQPKAAEIRDFRSYVAVAAYRACYEYLRRKYPKRHSLKHKLRFLLSHKTEFALWQTGRDEWHCGLAKWGDSASPASGTGEPVRTKFNQLRDDPQNFVHCLPGGTAASLPLDHLLKLILDWLGGPLELDQLVGLVAELRGIKDLPASEETPREAAPPRLVRLADPRANVAKAFDQRRYLETLWTEIAQMPPRHCAALLLNLKDERGGSATDLFIFTGVVRFSQLAQVLAIHDEELAQLWNQLPLDDLTIAERLGLTRQQVINLRQSARARLARRMNQLGF